MNNKFNIYNILNVASIRLSYLYENGETLPIFKLSLPKEECSFSFPRQFIGIFELLKDFASVWNILSVKQRSDFCELVGGLRNKEDLLWFMDILSERKEVNIK